MGLWERVTAPDTSLFFKKNDPNDVKLGETVLYQQDDYEMSDVVLIGLPQDEGVRRNGGRVGAKDAPDAIRQALYKLVNIPSLKFFDMGNSKIFPTLEETHAKHQAIIEHLLDDGKVIIVLGGGNDTSYPDCAALSTHINKNVLAFNIDAHFDIRADSPRNSGTPYRQLLDEGLIHPQNFYEIAYQPFANSPTYIDYLRSKGVVHHALKDVHDIGLEKLLNDILAHHKDESVFWGLDMDVVRAADAPAVSAVNPTGLTGEEFASIGRIAGQHPNTSIFEITEVNPTYDIDGRTCRLAATTIHQFLSTIFI
ncbi:MAG: formimidoylglutamase [Phototrophicaceae bacterium]